MNPLVPRPDELPIPAPWWVFQALHLLTFSLHVIAMNVLLGGSFLAALDLTRRDGWLARRLCRVLPVAFTATITLGVAPLLFVQVLFGPFIYSSSILVAWPWLSVVGCALVAYSLAYVQSGRAAGPRGPSTTLAWAQVLILLWIAFVYVQNVTLSTDPERWRAIYAAGPQGRNLHLAAEVFPRWLHFVVGAVAVAGLFVALAARSWSGGEGDGPERARVAASAGVRAFFVATIVEIVTGLAYLGHLPKAVRGSLLGGSVAGTALLAVGTLLSIHLVVSARVALRRDQALERARTLAAFAAAVLGVMVLLREHVRHVRLAPWFQAPQLASSPQWAILGTFLLLLLGGVGAIAWMVRAWVRAKPPGGVTGA